MAGKSKTRGRKKKPKLGTGKRFAALVRQLRRKGYSEDSARRIAASIGRKKYGAKKMAKWAAQGRKRKAKKK